MTHFVRNRSEQHCISDLVLDQLVGALLTDAQSASARGHLLRCLQCRQRFQQIAAGARVALPPLEVLRGGFFSGRRRILAPLLAPALAACLILFALLLPVDSPSIRTKGGERLGFYVKHGATVR